jgi:hypothetical protein
VRWPWQRSEERKTDAAPHGAAPPVAVRTVAPAGWAFLPPLQRQVSDAAPLVLRPAFVASLPTRVVPSSLGSMGHLVDPAAPAGTISIDDLAPGAPVQRSAAADLTVRHTQAAQPTVAAALPEQTDAVGIDDVVPEPMPVAPTLERSADPTHEERSATVSATVPGAAPTEAAPMRRRALSEPPLAPSIERRAADAQPTTSNPPSASGGRPAAPLQRAAAAPPWRAGLRAPLATPAAQGPSADAPVPSAGTPADDMPAQVALPADGPEPVAPAEPVPGEPVGSSTSEADSSPPPRVHPTLQRSAATPGLTATSEVSTKSDVSGPASARRPVGLGAPLASPRVQRMTAADVRRLSAQPSGSGVALPAEAASNVFAPLQESSGAAVAPVLSDDSPASPGVGDPTDVPRAPTSAGVGDPTDVPRAPATAGVASEPLQLVAVGPSARPAATMSAIAPRSVPLVAARAIVPAMSGPVLGRAAGPSQVSRVVVARVVAPMATHAAPGAASDSAPMPIPSDADWTPTPGLTTTVSRLTASRPGLSPAESLGTSSAARPFRTPVQRAFGLPTPLPSAPGLLSAPSMPSAPDLSLQGSRDPVPSAADDIRARTAEAMPEAADTARSASDTVTRTGQALASAAGAAPAVTENVEQLVRKLYGPLVRRIKAELLLDRERRGIRIDGI